VETILVETISVETNIFWWKLFRWKLCFQWKLFFGGKVRSMNSEKRTTSKNLKDLQIQCCKGTSIFTSWLCLCLALFVLLLFSHGFMLGNLLPSMIKPRPFHSISSGVAMSIVASLFFVCIWCTAK
jgi:hypothetical protein